MSKYRRDDKAFREQITTLADAGLKFPTAPAKLPEYTLHFDEMRTIDPPTRRGHFNLPGLIVGLLYMTIVGSVLGLAVVGVIALIGGVR